MNKSIFKGRKSGFTLAELLMVIAILVILVGLGVTGFLALRRNILIAKYDDLAREIYVAVQNQLTRLEANGLDEETVKTLNEAASITEKPEDYTPGDWDSVKTSYRHANQGDAKVMELLLPLGAVADDVRSNGFYVVEYNVQTRTVYSVFYSEKTIDYPSVAEGEFRNKRAARKTPMVGYYGGSSVERDDLKPCPTPELEIINNNELRLNILNVPTDTGLTVSVTVSDGIVEKPVEVDATQIKDLVAVNGKTVLLDGVKDDEHFYKLFPDLTPGKDLEITVTYSKPGFLTSSASITANSLFATREIGEEKTEGGVTYPNPGDTVTIAWARHLQNLENTVSHLNDDTITIARQTEHIRWNDGFILDFQSIRNDKANEKLLRYEGNNLEIRDLTGTNGLFAQTKENMELSGIRVVNPVINGAGSDPVGALVGTAKAGTKVNVCAVYSSKIASDGTVDYAAYKNCYVNGGAATTGGLIGTATNTTVGNSFAALPRIQANKGATLIGNATDCKITNSYANCDNLPEENFAYFLAGSGNTIQHCYAVGNVVKEDPGVFEDGANNTVTDSYYAVSHRKFAPAPKNNQDLAATEFRYIKNGDWQEAKQEEMQEKPLGTGWADGLIAPLTHPYREYLDGRGYPYPAIGELDHYGSWPDSDGTVDLKITMQLPNDKEADYAIFAGRVKVYNQNELDEEGHPILLFDSEKHKKNDGTFDGKDTVKVAPGTKVQFIIEAAEGYEYLGTDVFGEVFNEKKFEYEVKKDTEAIVEFQQKSFTLECLYPVGENGSELHQATYVADCGLMVLLPPNQAQVETDSDVVVRITGNPDGYPNGKQVVWYTREDENHNTPHYVQEDISRGTYTFQMPGANTKIHVMYTQKTATFKVEYYLMDANKLDGKGEYLFVHQSRLDKKLQYGIGTDINQQLIKILANSSNLPVTLEGENVLYLENAVVTKDAETVFHSISDKTGAVTYPPTDGNPDSVKQEYSTTDADVDKNFTIKIYIARATYELTLKKGLNIEEVSFGNGISGNLSEDGESISYTFRYGQSVEAQAEVIPGQVFTVWDSSDSRFRKSSASRYSFTMPHYPLTLTAMAERGKYLVSLELQENDDSWLASSASRRADPVTVYLVNSMDDSEIQMESLTQEDNSFLVQKIVPAIPELGQGYYIRVQYKSGLSEFYTTGGVYNEDPSINDRVMLTVRDRAVNDVIKFYSVTYHPNCEKYVGSAPTGGTYLENHRLKVAGNPGLLRNQDEKKDSTGSIMDILTGWRNVYAGVVENDETYGSGDILPITRQTDLFAEWAGSIRVYYEAPEATGGSLPVDAYNYNSGASVTVKSGVPERAGYIFQGWESSQNHEIYNGGDTFTIGLQDVMLTAQWEAEKYTLTYWELQEGEWKQIGKPVENLLYGAKLEAATAEILTNQEKFLGWATSVSGEVLYRAGDEITVTGDMKLYARTSGKKITVTYHSMDGKEKYGEQEFGVGISAYLTPPESDPAEVTAWSTEEDGKGRLYLCQDGTNRSQDPAAFAADTDLYAVIGKVYNVNQRTWYNTLYDAVNAKETTDGNTLIVYRNTEEIHRIEFNEDDLFILANGNRTVTWKEESKQEVDIHTGNNADSEFTGCMKVGNGRTVTFGDSNIETISMEGNTLTFNASNLGRVIALQGSCVFNMYDGVTLTNGMLPEKEESWESSGIKDNPFRRSYMGGGVYAGENSRFNMYGGTISYCSAYSGGGVYLYTGSKMQMGNMEQPTYYSSTATYYYKINEKDYENVQTPVGPENYKDQKYVVTGNPVICYNTATRKYKENFSYSDGGGGVLMLDLNDGDLILYSGSIHNNTANANGGGIMTDAGPAGDNKDPANKAKLRIYEVDISHNSSVDGYGGGIFQWQGILHVYNSTIRQNYAGKDGGGIYLHHYNNTEKSNIEFWYGDISGNRAKERGGGVYVESDLEMKIYSGHLYNNTADTEGGGVYLENVNNIGGKLYLSSGSIEDNRIGDWTNDVFLAGSSTITAMNSGLSFQQSGVIHVDCENPPVPDALNPNQTRLVVEYQEKDTSFKEEDADYFLYDPKSGDTNHLIVRPSDEKTLVLSMDPDSLRTVTFHANYISDGQVQEETYTQNDALVNTAIEYHDFTRQGYDLIGWATAPNATIEEYLVYRIKGVWYTKYENGQWLMPLEEGQLPAYTVTEGFDQQLYAMWKPYSVTYHLMTDSPDVTISQEESVGPKIRILFPTNQYTQGELTYTFIGWSTDENSKEPTYITDGQEITLTESLDLYAVWQPDKVTVTFDFNNGMQVGGQTSQTQLVPREQELPIPELSITRPGNLHKGWSKNQDSQTADYPIKGGIIQAADLKEDLTLYAVWAEAVTVTFDGNGGDSNGSLKLDQLIEKDSHITLDITPTRHNYDFLGWADTKEATEPKYKEGKDFGPVSANTTLYAVWRAKVPVKLMRNDGTDRAAWDTMESVGGEYTLGVPKRSGYKFLGWAKYADADTPEHQAEEKIAVPAEGITLYALWEKDPRYTVTLNPNGGTWEDETAETVTVTENEKGVLTIPERKPKQAGKVFLGWSEDGTTTGAQYQAGSTIRDLPSNQTFYAVWADGVTIQLYWNLTEGAYEDAVIPVGTEFTLPAPEAEREGYAFQGWSSNSDGSGELLQPGDIMTPSEDTALYAIWEENPRYTVTLDPSPGTWKDGTNTPQIFKVVNGTFTIPKEITPTQSGYSFHVWSRELPSGQAQYSPGSTIDNLTGDLTLTAVWNPQQSTQEPPNPANSETQNTDPPETEAPTEASAKEDPAASETPVQPETEAPEAPSEAVAQPETEAPEAPSEAADQPAAQAASVPTEERKVWKVSFYLDGVEFKKHPKLSGEELQECQWDEEEKWLIYDVPAGEEVKLLPPEIEREGYVLDGWLLLDENEDEEILYPAGEEIPVTDSMELTPVWKEAEPTPPPSETIAPTDPPATEAATQPPEDPKSAETTPPATDPKPAETTPPETEAPPPEAGEETAAP